MTDRGRRARRPMNTSTSTVSEPPSHRMCRIEQLPATPRFVVIDHENTVDQCCSRLPNRARRSSGGVGGVAPATNYDGAEGQGTDARIVVPP